MKTDDEYITYLQRRCEFLQRRCEPGMGGGRDILIPGQLQENQYWLLVDISNMHSTKVILALRDHLVAGESRKVVCERHGVNPGYFSTCLKRLLRINRTAASLSPYYSRDEHRPA